MAPWTLTIEQTLYSQFHVHLFPGDGDEHAAVIAAGMVATKRGTRLLARDLFRARDGIDFVQGVRGYRRLTPEFVREQIRYCRDEKLIYLAIHNHAGSSAVELSEGATVLLGEFESSVQRILKSRTRAPDERGRPGRESYIRSNS